MTNDRVAAMNAALDRISAEHAARRVPVIVEELKGTIATVPVYFDNLADESTTYATAQIPISEVDIEGTIPGSLADEVLNKIDPGAGFVVGFLDNFRIESTALLNKKAQLMLELRESYGPAIRRAKRAKNCEDVGRLGHYLAGSEHHIEREYTRKLSMLRASISRGTHRPPFLQREKK